MKDCEAFLSRARAHLEELEQKLSAVVVSISVRTEVGRSEDAARLPATPPPFPPTTTGHQCRGAKIAGFGESFASTVAWRRSRHSLWTRCETAMSCGRGVFLCFPFQLSLSAWLEERHADLHDALVNGDSGRILELTTMLAEGAERMVEPGLPLTRLRRLGRLLNPVEVNSSESESQVPGTRNQIVSAPPWVDMRRGDEGEVSLRRRIMADSETVPADKRFSGRWTGIMSRRHVWIRRHHHRTWSLLWNLIA